MVIIVDDIFDELRVIAKDAKLPQKQFNKCRNLISSADHFKLLDEQANTNAIVAAAVANESHVRVAIAIPNWNAYKLEAAFKDLSSRPGICVQITDSGNYKHIELTLVKVTVIRTVMAAFRGFLD